MAQGDAFSSGPDTEGFGGFLRELWADVDAGQLKPIDHYLESYPGDAERIATEYLAVKREMKASDDGARRIAHYRLIRQIGRGGQAVVWEAQDERLKRRTALKVIRTADRSPKVLDRFRREAEITSRLEHPGICPVYEIGFDEAPWIAMRFVDGETISSRISSARTSRTDGGTEHVSFEDEASTENDGASRSAARRDQPPCAAADFAAMARLIEGTAAALHAAHEAGVVHRDIKPGNIMVGADGQPVLLDFGLARLEDGDALTLTMTGDLFGTPAYMSPEQIKAGRKSLDRRTDIYSLGVTLFECLAGRHPFERNSREAMFNAIVTEPVPDVRTCNPAVSRELAAVLATMLQKDRDDRYDTAQDVAEELRRLREGNRLEAQPQGAMASMAEWAGRRRVAVAAVGGVLLAIVAIVSAITALDRKAPESHSPTDVHSADEDDSSEATPSVPKSYAAFALWTGPHRPLTGAAEPDATKIEVIIDEEAPRLTTIDRDRGEWTFSSEGIEDGEHTATLIVTNESGEQTLERRTIRVDSTKPLVQAIAPKTATHDTAIIRVQITDAGLCEATVEGESIREAIAAAGGGHAEVPVKLHREGPNDLMIEARDVAGNVTRSPLTIDRQTAKPSVTFIDSPGPVAPGMKPRFRFDHTMSGRVTINGGLVRNVKPGEVLTLDAVGSGEDNTYRVVAVDEDGRELTETRAVFAGMLDCSNCKGSRMCPDCDDPKERVESCRTCAGLGFTTASCTSCRPCTGCAGAGKKVCGRCRGRGKQPCGARGCNRGTVLGARCAGCDGTGDKSRGLSPFKIPCGKCRGTGKLAADCPQCVGGWTDCGICKGAPITCSNCTGTGLGPCETCNGTRTTRLPCSTCRGGGRRQRPCKTCKDGTCTPCKGRGYVPR